jgi:hypothetical protein
MDTKRPILIHSFQAIILGALISLHLIGINLKSGSAQVSDFFQFYQSARYLFQGDSIYTPIPCHPSEEIYTRITDKAKVSRTTFFPNMNSPLHTFFMAPFAMMPLSQGFWIWSILSLVFGLLAVGLVAFNAIPEKNKLTSFFNLAIILFAYFPTFANVILGGQWGLCLLLLVVLIWLAARKEKYIAAGIVLGLAMSSKIIFAIFLVLIRK